MAETREEAVAQLEGLREQRPGSVLIVRWSEPPELVIPRPGEPSAHVSWEGGVWVVRLDVGWWQGWPVHRAATLADCLEWLEGQA